jgi:hypothetical protein
MSQFLNQVGNVTAPYFIEVVVRGTVARGAGDIVNAVTVFNFRRLTNSGIFDPTDIASVFKAAWEPVYKAVVTPEFAFNQHEVRQMDDPTAATAIEPSATVGTLAQDLYAPDTAIYMQLKTGFRGRSYFGSKHFAGAGEGQIDKGLLITAGRTAWDTVRTLMLNWTTAGLVDTATNSWKLCIVSRVLSNLTASPAVFTGADVTSIVTNARVGTMGRRRGARTAF